ncbi:MAG: hypothetical protein WC787_04025 [Patescibacteria group bacterium]
MSKSVALAISVISFTEEELALACKIPEIEIQRISGDYVVGTRISYNEDEFAAFCDDLAWRDPVFCERYVAIEKDEGSRRFATLRESDPFINLTAIMAEDDDDQRDTIEHIDDEQYRETIPVGLPMQQAA